MTAIEKTHYRPNEEAVINYRSQSLQAKQKRLRILTATLLKSL